MKKLLLGACILMGSLNAMEDTGCDDIAKWCVNNVETITAEQFTSCLADNRVELHEFLKYPVPTVKDRTQPGDTWLHIFVYVENKEVVQILSDAGADWGAADVSGTPANIVASFEDGHEFKVFAQGLMNKSDLNTSLDLDEMEGGIKASEEALAQWLARRNSGEHGRGAKDDPSEDWNFKDYTVDTNAAGNASVEGLEASEEADYLTYDEAIKLVLNRPGRGVVMRVMKYLTEGKLDKPTFNVIWLFTVESDADVCKMKLKNGQSLGEWLLDEVSKGRLCKERAYVIISLEGLDRLEAKQLMVLETDGGQGPADDEASGDAHNNNVPGKEEQELSGRESYSADPTQESERTYLTYSDLNELTVTDPSHKELFIHLIKFLIKDERGQLQIVMNDVESLGRMRKTVRNIGLTNGQSLGEWLQEIIENGRIPQSRAHAITTVVGLPRQRTPVEEPLSLNPVENEPSKPKPTSFLGKLFYGSAAVAIVYTAWHYLGYTSPDKSNKALPST